MKVNDLRELTQEELDNKLIDFREEYYNLRYQSATGHVENPKRIREVKKDIARILTIFRERELYPERMTGEEEPEGVNQ